MLMENPDLQAFSKLKEILINITHVHSIPAINYNKRHEPYPPNCYISQSDSTQNIVANLEKKLKA
jgi:hypothetical protein